MGGATDSTNGRGLSVRVGTRPPEVARPRKVVVEKPDRVSAIQDIGRLFVTDGDSLRSARTELVCRLRSREAELQKAVFAHVRSVVPDTIADGDAQLAVGLREMIAACVDCGLTSIEQGAQWSGPIPSVVAAQARRAAASGVSLITALCRCIASYTLAWSFVLNEVAHHELPDEQRSALLLQASAAMGSLLARVQAEIADAHISEIKRSARSREQRRAEIVRKLLADERVDVGELVELGYELDAWHLAVIATGADAEKTIRCLATGLGRQLLPIAHGEEAVCGSLGGQHKPAFADVEHVLSTQEQADVSLAVGEPARGVEGWRLTHQEARAALLVAQYGSSKLTRYSEVALEATALQDDALADSLIETYLTPLDDEHGGGLVRRRVLRALFDAEHNKSSAAHVLDMDRDTIHRQVKEIERRLGCRLHERQAELEVGLRIEELRANAMSSAR